MVTKIIKNDRYKRVRGGSSKLLQISCEKCNSIICLYQKDGPGMLRRMYLDRIIDPQASVSGESLCCSNNHLLGVKIIYEKEKRPAFRLITNSFTKKIKKQ